MEPIDRESAALGQMGVRIPAHGAPFAVPKPRKRPKSRPKGLKRSRMKPSRKPLRSKGGPPRDSERMAFVRSHECVACLVTGQRQRSKSEADHVRTRRLGGKEAANLWPLCRKHHDERHVRGLKEFEYTYRVVGKEWARFFEDQYTLHIMRAGGIEI